MNHTHTARRLAVVLAALFAGASVALPAMGTSVNEPTYLVVTDTPEGIVEKIVTESELDIMVTCNADAPTTPSCTNGPLTRFSAAGHGLVLPIPSGFGTPAGDVAAKKMIFTSFLRSSTTERIFRCEVTQTPAPAGTGAIAFTCFPGSGSFPPVGSAMTQTAVGLAAPQGGAGDTTSLTAYQSTGGAVLIPGLGKFTAQLTN